MTRSSSRPNRWLQRSVAASNRIRLPSQINTFLPLPTIVDLALEPHLRCQRSSEGQNLRGWQWRVIIQIRSRTGVRQRICKRRMIGVRAREDQPVGPLRLDEGIHPFNHALGRESSSC